MFMKQVYSKGLCQRIRDHVACRHVTELYFFLFVHHEVVFDLNVLCPSVELGVFGVVNSRHAITVQSDWINCTWYYFQAYQQAPEPYSLLCRCCCSNVLSLHFRQRNHLLFLASPGDGSPVKPKNICRCRLAFIKVSSPVSICVALKTQI